MISPLAETQIAAIRDLMLEASTRGDWLTLAEIAATTGFGEASISAQLRHLRKPRFGRFRVEKQRRGNSSLQAPAVITEGARVYAPWEYRVLARGTLFEVEKRPSPAPFQPSTSG